MSKRIQRCFGHFSQGLSVAKIVVLMQLDPRIVRDLKVLWTQRGRPTEIYAEHAFQIIKTPFGFGCLCGFESPVLSPDGFQEAAERVNEHMDAAKASEGARIIAGPLTSKELLAARAAAHERDQESLLTFTHHAARERERAAAVETKYQADERQSALDELEKLCFQFFDQHGGDRDSLSSAIQAAKATQEDLRRIRARYEEHKKVRAKVVHRVSVNRVTSSIECTCGYKTAYDTTNQDSLAGAAERLNKHLRDCLNVGYVIPIE
jgi:hypothetical protein